MRVHRLFHTKIDLLQFCINPQCGCTLRVIVVHWVCLSVCQQHFSEMGAIQASKVASNCTNTQSIPPKE